MPDKYPVLHLHDFAANLHGKVIFSKLDLHKAYNQIPVATQDSPKTAVVTAFGFFEYPMMTFGLRNAEQTFQRYIFQAVGDLDFVFCYIDDILMFSSNLEEHREHLRMVFQRLKKFGLRLNLGKCQLGKTELEFLGYTINNEGSKPTSVKIQAILQFSKPRTIVELRKFLGLVNFYRRSLPHAADIQAPLDHFLRDSCKNNKRVIAWTPEAEESFDKIKNDLANATLLSHPSAKAETRLVSDASDFGIGAALEQWISGSWKPLAFFSRKFTPAQCSYSTYDRELTAVYEAVRYFRHFLEGQNFKICTVHKPLSFAFAQRSAARKLLLVSSGNCLIFRNTRPKSNFCQARTAWLRTVCRVWTHRSANRMDPY